MEQYVKVVKKRIAWLSAGIIAVTALGICRAFLMSEDASRTIELLYGVLIGLEFVAVFRLVHYRKALQSELLLKKEYNWERDERMQAIRAKAGVPFVLFTSVAMLLAGSVIGYYSDVAFYTLVGAAVLQLLASGLVKVYYQKTM